VKRLALSVLAVVVLASCDTGTPPDTTAHPTTSSTETTSPVPSTTAAAPLSTTTLASIPEAEVGIYLFFEGYPVEPGPYLAAVSRQGLDDLERALAALFEGATEAEAALGLSSTIPEGTELLGVEVSEGVAYVDVSIEFGTGGGSLSMMGRVAQVVYTATRFPGVESVRFFLEGAPLDVLGGEGLIIDEPQTRAAWVEMIPPILIEQPLWGSTHGNELSFSGTAKLDSGSVSFVVVDADGLIVHEGEITSIPSELGKFSEDLVIDQIPHPGTGSIIAWEWAPDGSQRHVVEYPVSLVNQD